MNKCKEFFKFHFLPKRLYLRYSAWNKYRKADKTQETELRLLPQLVDNTKNAIDVGANTGLYTFFLSKYAKQVFAFEPHKLFAEFLSKAVANNVIVINKGVSNQNASLPFYVPVKSGRMQMNIASFDEKTAVNWECIEEKVKTVTLDSMQYKNIGYIKIDVEGHEYEVLEGAVELIRTQKPIVQIEMLGISNDKMKNRSLNFLIDQGYEIYVYAENKLNEFNSVSPSCMGKNFICIPVSRLCHHD